jgi:hypothetical protein
MPQRIVSTIKYFKSPLPVKYIFLLSLGPWKDVVTNIFEINREVIVFSRHVTYL